MTSTQTPTPTVLHGTAAAQPGELVRYINAAGEILVGLVGHFTRRGEVAVTVGANRLQFWPTNAVQLTTPAECAAAVRVGDELFVDDRGDWRLFRVTNVARTRITVTRKALDGHDVTRTVPAWAALRMAW